MRPTTKFLCSGLLALTLTVPLAACGDDDADVSTGDDATTTVAPDTGAPDDSAPDSSATVPDDSTPGSSEPGTSADLYEFQWYGLSKDDAIAKADADGVTYRIGREDDETFALTEDFQEGRVTFSIDDGVVTMAVTESEGTAGQIEGAENPDDLDYVGLSEDDAMAMAETAGVTARVISRDDEQIVVTMDYSADRLNFHVEKGIVVGVTRG